MSPSKNWAQTGDERPFSVMVLGKDPYSGIKPIGGVGGYTTNQTPESPQTTTNPLLGMGVHYQLTTWWSPQKPSEIVLGGALKLWKK